MNGQGYETDKQVRAVLVLFQAMRPLMVKGGKFIALGSGSGTINQVQPPGQGTYGMTKVSLTKRLQARAELIRRRPSTSW